MALIAATVVRVARHPLRAKPCCVSKMSVLQM
jgi:hypothetical protein